MVYFINIYKDGYPGPPHRTREGAERARNRHLGHPLATFFRCAYMIKVTSKPQFNPKTGEVWE